MTQNIQPYRPKEIVPAVESFSTELQGYLDFLGLPTDNVLVEIEPRRVVINNTQTVLDALSEQQRKVALYVSKFVAACVVGLFDAALNYLWDETIRNLRDKVARFDLEYFFDSVTNDTARRSKLKTDADLETLDDWELIKSCRITGIITEIGYKHLDYIRDMRNWASAAHPNQNELTGLQIVSWLETCIREVLAKEPDGPVIEIRRLLKNLRKEDLDPNDVKPIAETLPGLPGELSASLLRSIFGMYTDLDVAADVRDNIKLVAQAVWDACTDEPKYEAGMKLASLKANGEVSRAKLAREFLDLVNGLTYLPQESMALEISTAVDTLQTVHNGFSNFSNELAPARLLQKLVPVSGQVPNAIVKKYIKVISMCKIGNGYGISWVAEPIYDELIGRFSDGQSYWFVDLLNDPEVASRLSLGKCSERYQFLAGQLEQKVVNTQLKQTLKFIVGLPTGSLHNIRADSRFQRLQRAVATVK